MPDVLVVGAGISGLTAAWRLHQAGVEVAVLERSTRPGGRVHSIELNGCVLEAGANFVTDAYRIVPTLAHEAAISLQPVRNDSAIAMAGRLHAFRADRPGTAVTAGLLPARMALSQVPGLARFAARSRGRGTLDPLDWRDLDDTLTGTWARRLGLTALAERSWRPAFHGFYFQEALTSSAAAVAAMATHGLRQRTLTVPGGLSGLTDALAARLDVRTGVSVTDIEEGPSAVTVRTDRGDLRAAVVIVAVPGPDLPGLMALNPLETAAARTPYSAGLLIGLGVERHLHSHELAGAYGVLMHPDERPLAAICVASRAGHAHGPGDVVTCMFADRPAGELARRSDAQIVEAAREALLAWAPELRDALLAGPDANRVVRIPHAMPTSRPGRLTAIHNYRRHAEARRVLLAGDCLAWPWTDSAAFTGQWAAKHALRRVQPAR